jgi:hypothetical protein
MFQVSMFPQQASLFSAEVVPLAIVVAEVQLLLVSIKYIK